MDALLVSPSLKVSFVSNNKFVGLRKTESYPFAVKRVNVKFAAHGKSSFSSRKSSFVVFAGQKWVLSPVGDGDYSHLGETFSHAGPIEVDFEAAVVGRESEKADIVVPIPTVSGRHARLEVKAEKLFVTDLDSTNGTFLGGRRLRPGSVTELTEGSVILFGDEHLALFQVTKAEIPEVSSEPTA